MYEVHVYGPVIRWTEKGRRLWRLISSGKEISSREFPGHGGYTLYLYRGQEFSLYEYWGGSMGVLILATKPKLAEARRVANALRRDLGIQGVAKVKSHLG